MRHAFQGPVDARPPWRNASEPVTACRPLRRAPGAMAFVLLFLVLGGCAGKSTPSPRRQTYDSAKILSATKVVRKSKGDRIVNTARSLIDTPYRWGGRSPRTGFDCSGFVWYVFRKHGVDLPRTSTQLLSVGRHVDAFAIRSGDILIYNVSKKGKSLHVAIATGRGTFVHSPSSGKGVSEVSMSGPYWKDRLLDARRVL